ncbi:MAG TPA: serine/threonine-protein kinase [Polyangia bacterium]|nr:serine/threonine-protein kinase [Polyangia bacterium]
MHASRFVPVDARAGTTVGKYKLHELVGRGGMGVVYRGEHVYIGKEVAVKILHEGYGGREESIKRFLREARAASLIAHPNIVNVTDFGKTNDGTVFFVMEFLRGEALDALLHREQHLQLLRAITIMNQLAGAVGAAHAKGIVHRDLKPENVMLLAREGRRELIRQFIDESGAHTVSEREKTFDLVKILDFGVAKVHDPEVAEGRVTQQGIVFGTPEYMAPETARVGISDPRSDIWALGVMFYEMLTGRVPFSGDTPVDVMMKVVSQPVIPPRERGVANEITEEAEQLIMRALAKDPNARQQSMEELYDELQRCYGSVRYRRSLEASPPWSRGMPQPPQNQTNTPIPLQKVKRQGNRAAAAGEIRTPPPSPQTPAPRPAGQASGARSPGPEPILLTRRKDRKRTLPMDLEINDGSPVVTPAAAGAPAPITRQTTGEVRAGDSDIGNGAREDDWADLANDEDEPDAASIAALHGDAPASPAASEDATPTKERDSAADQPANTIKGGAA